MKLFRSPNFRLTVITVISFLFLLSSYLPNFYEASVIDLMPPDRVMLWGEHIYTYDYNVYLSKIRQGNESRWLTIDKYDNQIKQNGSLVYEIYLLSGKIGNIFRFDPPLTFHLLRTVLSIIWVLTIIYLNIYFLKKPFFYSIGILFSLLTASWPVFYRFQNQWWVGMHMDWWQEMDILKRISYLPHYLLNYISVALLFLLLHKFSKNLKTKHFLYICLILFLSAFNQPAGAILFLIAWVIYYSMRIVWFKSYNKKQVIDIFSYSIILVIAAAIPLLYLRLAFSTYPLKSITDFDLNNRLAVDLKEYILALGPIFFTGILGLIIAFIKKEERLLPFISWITAAFIAIIVFKYLPYHPIRFVQTANHIPLALLSAYFISRLMRKRILITLIVLPIIFLGIVQSYFSVKAQTDFIHQRAVAGQPLVPYAPQVMYPLKDFWNGLQWLGKNTDINSIVLSQYTAGNYIPAYSGNFVYFGHNPETVFYAEKEMKVNLFFSGTMSDEQALNFLRKENISYIFYGPQEKEKSLKDINKYKFLKPVFNSQYVTIFKIQLT